MRHVVFYDHHVCQSYPPRSLCSKRHNPKTVYNARIQYTRSTLFRQAPKLLQSTLCYNSIDLRYQDHLRFFTPDLRFMIVTSRAARLAQLVNTVPTRRLLEQLALVARTVEASRLSARLVRVDIRVRIPQRVR